MIEHVFHPLPCHEAATEIERVLGLRAFGPLVGQMVQELRSCNNPACPGTPRLIIVAEAMARAEDDAVLALRN